MPQVSNSFGPDYNNYSLYATSNSTAHDHKVLYGAVGPAQGVDNGTAYTSNFQRFTQGTGRFEATTVNGETQRLAREAAAKNPKAPGGVSGFACNFGPTVLSTRQLDQVCGTSAKESPSDVLRRAKPANASDWRDRSDIVVRRTVGGAQLNQPAPELHAQLYKAPMVSEAHSASAVYTTLPLLASRPNRIDLTVQRGACVPLGRSIEKDTTMKLSYRSQEITLTKPRPPRNELAASRTDVLGSSGRKLGSGWNVNAPGFAANSRGAEAAVAATAAKRRRGQEGSDERATFATSGAAAFQRKAVGGPADGGALRKATTSYATSRQSLTFLPPPGVRNRIITTPPSGLVCASD